MARTSNKDKALAYAAEHGIILTVEDRDNFDGDYAVEVWSHTPADTNHHTEHPVMSRLDKCPACGDDRRPCECGLL